MEKTAIIQVEVNEELKQNVDALFNDLGLDTATAIRIFLNKSMKCEGLPFEVARLQPNAETLVAMLDEMEIIPKSYDSFDEILAEIEAEIGAER